MEEGGVGGERGEDEGRWTLEVRNELVLPKTNYNYIQ